MQICIEKREDKNVSPLFDIEKSLKKNIYKKCLRLKENLSFN